MNLVNIGFGNLVNADRIISVVSPESAPVKRIVQQSKSSIRRLVPQQGARTLGSILPVSNMGI